MLDGPLSKSITAQIKTVMRPTKLTTASATVVTEPVARPTARATTKVMRIASIKTLLSGSNCRK